MTVHTGWYLLGLTDEIGAGPTPFSVGGRALIAIRDGDTIRVFDGSCPHRGAHLGHGGTLARGAVVCPFHGKRIALGDPSCHWHVAEHRVLLAEPVLFVRLSTVDADDRGFERAVKAITADRRLAVGYDGPIAVPAEYVVENAFDPDHFTAVHDIKQVNRERLDVGPDGELEIELEFRHQPPPWSGRTGTLTASHFHARAYSPTIVVTELGVAEGGHVVITAATPTPTGCQTRIVYAITAAQEPSLPGLIAGGRRAIAQDIQVWEHLDLTMPPRYDARDAPVRAFRRFCAGFGTA